MNLKQLLSEFLLEMQLQNYSQRTIKQYKNNVGGLLTFAEKELKITEVNQLTHQHIKLYVRNKQANGLSESYINSIIKGVKSFYNYLVKEEYVEKNIVDKVELLKMPITIIETPTDEEVKNMLRVYDFSDFLNARNKCILSVLIDTGVRNFELCNIMMEDVKDNYILIKAGKGNKQRVVPISKNLHKIISKYKIIREKYIKTIHEDKYLFLSRTGRQLTIGTVENIVKQAGEIAGVDSSIRCSPHTLRHYYAQSQLKNNLDLYYLSRILGHTDIKITKRYLQSIHDEEIILKGSITSPLNNFR